MAKRGHQGGDKPNDELTIVLAIISVCVVVWLLWEKFRPEVVFVVYGMDWLQYRALHMLGLLGPHGLQMERYVRACLWRQIDPNTVSLAELKATQADIGHRVRWFMAAVIIGLAILVMTKMKGEGFRRSFTLSGSEETTVHEFLGVRLPGPLGGLAGALLGLPLLGKLFALVGLKSVKRRISNAPSFMHYQAQYWRVTKPGANFEPDVDDTNLNQSLTPPEWLEANGIALTEQDGLDIDAAELAFARQLGLPWDGIRKQPLAVRAIATLAFLNKTRAGRKLDDFRNDVAAAYAAKDVKTVEKLVADHLSDAAVHDIDGICGKHSYTNVALLALLGKSGAFEEWGGGDGSVMSPSMYLWLKSQDRQLFYILHNHGRRAFYVEGAGPVSHFFCERLVGEPMLEPQINGAIDGLEHYLDHHCIKDVGAFLTKMRARI